MDVCSVAGGSGSKLFNLIKGIEIPDTPQHRSHCTPPSHNSSRHDEHPVPQHLLPTICRLSGLLLDPHPQGNHLTGNHERWQTRLASSVRSRAAFSRNENTNEKQMRLTSSLPTRAASSLQTQADPRGPLPDHLKLKMGLITKKPFNQPTNQPTNHPTTQPPIIPTPVPSKLKLESPRGGTTVLKRGNAGVKGGIAAEFEFLRKNCATVPS